MQIIPQCSGLKTKVKSILFPQPQGSPMTSPASQGPPTLVPTLWSAGPQVHGAAHLWTVCMCMAPPRQLSCHASAPTAIEYILSVCVCVQGGVVFNSRQTLIKSKTWYFLVVKDVNSGTWVLTLALPFTSWTTVGESLNFSLPPFPHL